MFSTVRIGQWCSLWIWISKTKAEGTLEVNYLLAIFEPDESRGDKLYTTVSWDDADFLVNLQIRRTGLSKRERENYGIITVPMQFLS